MDRTAIRTERHLLSRLADILLQTQNLTSMRILEMSQKISPSDILHYGGTLFETYILRNGRPQDVALLETKFESKQKLSDDEMDDLKKQYMFPFWFYVISTARYLTVFIVIT